MHNKKDFQRRSELEKARASALASLSMREHSVKELSTKLQQKGYADDSISTVLQECLANNYLNDERFAEIYWRNRSAKGFGAKIIENELKFKGINSEIIGKSKNQEEIDFEKIIQRLYLKKFKGSAIADFKDKIKRQNYLYRRGFERELINFVLEDFN